MSDVSDVDLALESNLLMPSITNIIDVLGKPYLMTWYAKRAAEDAVKVANEHPGLIQKKPKDAISWISGAAKRTASAAADLGDEVHNAVEMLAAGAQPEGEVSDAAQKYVNNWHAWVEKYSPKFLHLEATVFGVTELGGKAYAGTADFIAEINGKVYVGDYKTGKSVHGEAALQLSALSHGLELVADGAVVELPKVDGEIVVHLQSDSYAMYQATDSDQSWATFSGLREIWDAQKKMQGSPRGSVWGFQEIEELS